jgi:hypothetical protein
MGVKLGPDIKGGTKTEGFSEPGDENTWTEEGWK